MFGPIVLAVYTLLLVGHAAVSVQRDHATRAQTKPHVLILSCSVSHTLSQPTDGTLPFHPIEDCTAKTL